MPSDPAAPGQTHAGPLVHTVALASGREAVIQVFPTSAPRRGTIAFSHGFESEPGAYLRIITPWQQAGYDVWAPLHVDSRKGWLREDFPGLATWGCRVEDMHALAGLFDGPYVAAGHSYGALIALVLGGAHGRLLDGMTGPLHDPRARCVVAWSPPPIITEFMEAEGYGGTTVPSLVQTGDADLMPGWPEMDEGWRVHLDAHLQAPADGDRYLAFLEGVDHYFGNAICEPGRAVPPQLERLGDMVDLSLAFIAAFHPAVDFEARQRLDERLADHGPVQLTRK